MLLEQFCFIQLLLIENMKYSLSRSCTFLQNWGSILCSGASIQNVAKIFFICTFFSFPIDFLLHYLRMFHSFTIILNSYFPIYMKLVPYTDVMVDILLEVFLWFRSFHIWVSWLYAFSGTIQFRDFNLVCGDMFSSGEIFEEFALITAWYSLFSHYV